jgi:CheY-like chemotaxis protein
MRILIVDDEPHLRRMMRLALESDGHDVTEAASGEEALSQFGDGTRFDATVLDQRMPGMDGLETLRRMKRLRADATVVMVTAYATIELAIEAMKLGAIDFVRKPMAPDTLRHAVAAAVAGREAAVVGAAAAAATAPIHLDVAVLPAIDAWTTNGFFVRRAPAPAGTASEHHFLVRRGRDSVESDVIVEIDPRVARRVLGARGEPLSVTGTFWRQQAQTALVNYLWSEASLPDDNRLVIDRAGGPVLDAALDWSGD